MTSSEALARLQAALESALGSERVAGNRPLAPMTTFKVGGPADLFAEPRSSEEVVLALRLAHDCGVPVTMLGGGSNVLVADSGIRGLVLRPRGGHITRENDARVRADAAVTINGFVRWLISHGLTGLEAWAGTPGTVGGGIYGNAHWAGRLLSDVVVGVRLARVDGVVSDVSPDAMEFAYDRSRLQRTGEVLLSALFAVSPGNPERLRETARASLAYRKRTQPLASPSAGCIFQNPAASVALPPGVPASAGALIDRAGLRGAAIGGAIVSPTHANFIVNSGTATAADIRALVGRCRQAVAEAFAVTLAEEIVYLGDFGPGAGGESVDVTD
jgi:UDP-N-acetylmuramate dehydrogenase